MITDVRRARENHKNWPYRVAGGRADGLIIASPEYIRAIPGGLANAIDWLVSRDEIIAKAIALLRASLRSEDMLAQLRLVLSTVSQGFSAEVFAGSAQHSAR